MPLVLTNRFLIAFYDCHTILLLTKYNNLMLMGNKYYFYNALKDGVGTQNDFNIYISLCYYPQKVHYYKH